MPVTRRVTPVRSRRAEPAIHVRKAVNALNPWAPSSVEDANSRAVSLVVGDSVVYTYLVTNTGGARLWLDAATAVWDDNGTPNDDADDFFAEYVGGDSNGDGWLDLSETWLFTSTVMQVRVGTVVNRAVAIGCLTEEATVCVSDDDTAAYAGQRGEEGHTPGFWKTNVDTKGAVAWPRTDDGTLVLDPTNSVRSLFGALPSQYDSVSLHDALGLKGGGVSALLRHAVAAVLNAIHPDVGYPLSAAEVIARVDAAIASGDRSAIEALKDLLAGYNELGSDLDANGRTPSSPAGSAPTVTSVTVSTTSLVTAPSTTTTAAAPSATTTLAPLSTSDLSRAPTVSRPLTATSEGDEAPFSLTSLDGTSAGPPSQTADDSPVPAPADDPETVLSPLGNGAQPWVRRPARGQADHQLAHTSGWG